MRWLPDASRGRLLAVVLLLITLLLVYVTVVHWWFVAPHLALRNELIEQREQEFRFRTTAQQRTAVEQALAEVRAFEAGNPGFLAEANFDLAYAALIARVDNVVAQAGSERCSVVSRTPYRPREAELFQRVTARLRLRCEVGELTGVLHALEGGSPMLFVDNVNIRAQRGYVPRGQRQPQGFLDVNFDLSGFLRLRGVPDG